MAAEHDGGFLQGLSYEDLLPLEWRRCGTEGRDAAAARLNDANEDMLRMLAIIEERTLEKPDEPGAASAELLRLEAKVNLLLDMMGQVLSNHVVLPDPVPVRLGAAGMEFAHTAPPRAGEHIVASLYLHPHYPRPLEVMGEVVAANDTGSGAHWVHVGFEQISPAVQDWLERFIFRRHRRMIAQSRTAPRHHGG